MNENPRDFLAEYLAQRDEPCPSCRYSLRGLQGAVCPECGQALVLRVGLAEPRMAAWIFGLVGISSGLGISFLFLVLVVIEMLFFAGGIWGFEMLVAGCALLICLFELWIWVRQRGRVCRMDDSGRWIMALGVAAFALIGPIAFIVMVV